MQGKKWLAIAIVCAGLVALLLPLTADAANWSKPIKLGSGNKFPSVAIDSNGNIHYAWWNLGSNTIEYKRCNANNGGCTKTETISGGTTAYYPAIAIDSKNRPNVVWEARASDTRYAVYFRRKNGNSWQAVRRVSTGSEFYAEVPDIAIGSNDVIHVSYQTKSGSTANVLYATSANGKKFKSFDNLATIDNMPLTGAVAELGGQSADIVGTEGTKLSAGLFPRIAVGPDNLAYVTWNVPSPYGIYYRHQNGGGWSSTIRVAAGSKDQTPDITVDGLGRVGIVWARGDSFDVSYAQFENDNMTHSSNGVGGGQEWSLWPRISADCGNNFHIVFQGSREDPGHNWNIYYRSFDGSGNWSDVQQVAAGGAQEQVPNISTTDRAAVIYSDTNNVFGSVADLGVTCGSEPPPPTNTPQPTATPDPNVPPTITPIPGAETWIPNTSSDIKYRKSWIKYNDKKATDKNYQRCDNGSVCAKGSAAKIVVPDGITKVEFYTAKAQTYGLARVWINADNVDNPKPSGKLDLCQGNSGLTPKFVKYTFEIPYRSDGFPRTFEIGAMGKHSGCSPYGSNYVVVDGFRLLP